MDNHKFSKTVFITGSLYYLLAEFICALLFNDSLVNTYLYHTISELGIPNANSPLSLLMNSAFILIGLALILGSFYGFKNYIIKNKRLFYLLTLVTAIGVIIVGLIHGGNPLTSGYHTTGAVMAILGGNILLVVISQSTSESGGYEKATLLLAVIGLIAFWVMFFNINSIYMPVFERLSVYTLIIWCFLTGLHLK
ncbi:MAG: DUF998 domain-containing protein [Methanosphaera sp.]|nr:DUF998 domain-containing protein [Methanosphaera sp.]